MAIWKRLFGRDAQPEPSDGPARAEGAGRFSVWERLAGDPGAAALRAQWMARWDEF